MAIIEQSLEDAERFLERVAPLRRVETSVLRCGLRLAGRHTDLRQVLIDCLYVVAFSNTLQYELVKAGTSLRHSLISREELVNRYPGKFYYQTPTKPSMTLLGYPISAII